MQFASKTTLVRISHGIWHEDEKWFIGNCDVGFVLFTLALHTCSLIIQLETRLFGAHHVSPPPGFNRLSIKLVIIVSHARCQGRVIAITLDF